MIGSIKLKIIDERIGTIWPFPNYASDGAAGVDLRACINDPLILHTGEVHIIKTGIAIHIEDPRYAGLVVPRSGLGTRGLVLGNLIGLIDSDYQGEIMLSAWNRNETFGATENKDIVIEAGDRIAQLVIVPVAQVQFEIVNHFKKSDRGVRGFGSTGA